MQVQKQINIYGDLALFPLFSFDSHISKIKLFFFESSIWADILEIVWMIIGFPYRITSLEKRLVYVYDNIENEESWLMRW